MDNNCLIVTDVYSKYPCIYQTSSTSTRRVLHPPDEFYIHQTSSTSTRRVLHPPDEFYIHQTRSTSTRRAQHPPRRQPCCKKKTPLILGTLIRSCLTTHQRSVLQRSTNRKLKSSTKEDSDAVSPYITQHWHLG